MHRPFRLQTTTTATALATGAVGGDGRDVFDAANLHAGTGKGAESALATGTVGLGSVTARGADLHVHSRDSSLLAQNNRILSSQLQNPCISATYKYTQITRIQWQGR